MINEIQNAKELFYPKKYKQAFEIFELNNEFYYAGLCCLLQKDLDKAKEFFEKNFYFFLFCLGFSFWIFMNSVQPSIYSWISTSI